MTARYHHELTDAQWEPALYRDDIAPVAPPRTGKCLVEYVRVVLPHAEQFRACLQLRRVTSPALSSTYAWTDSGFTDLMSATNATFDVLCRSYPW
jgi:hypothetical protein